MSLAIPGDRFLDLLEIIAADLRREIESFRSTPCSWAGLARPELLGRPPDEADVLAWRLVAVLDGPIGKKLRAYLNDLAHELGLE